MTRAILSVYRVRLPLYYVAAALLVGNVIAGRFVPTHPVRTAVVLGALALAVICVATGFLAPRLLARRAVRTVDAAVRGRWLGLNSPASKTPSHGVHAHGQAYAIDLVAEPVDVPRPAFGERMFRHPQDYPAFGAPVAAMIDGTVVRASGWRRDHRARSNLWGFVYMTMEGMIRELGGPGFVVGNHVTIRGTDGTFATVAHLQRGSLAVQVGDTVRAGALVGRCGNSGNSSEPHVHAQLADRASFWLAQGVPMRFAGVRVGDEPTPVDGLPENGQHLVADAVAQV